MAALPTQAVDPVVAAIYQQYELREGAEKARTYLGASVIGRECERALWYSFRWASREIFDGRKLRLFQTGHLAEPRFVSDLRSIGATVYDVDPATGKQFGYQSLGGHMRGHMDGAASKIPGGGAKWHVLEFKTHSAKSFADLKKKGVKAAKPEHYAQMCWYMGKTGMDRALYLAVDKDTDELYSERIEFDPTLFAKLEAKAERIIFSSTPPGRISEDPKFYLCNWCSHSHICHGMQVPPPSCRTCVHSTPEREGDGRWSCAIHPEGAASSIPVEFQRTGCGAHLPLPFLLTYADAIDAGTGWIEFQRRDTSARFFVAAEGTTPPSPELPTYSTHEISAAKDHRLIADPEVEKYRNDFDGVIAG